MLLVTLIGIRLFAPQQELRESRRVIYDIRTELDSLGNELRAVLDSVSDLRATRSSLSTEVMSLREDRSQYFSDTYERVVVDVYDIAIRELETLEDEVHRAIQYQELLEWLEVGRQLELEHRVPEVDSITELATLARVRAQERFFRDRFFQLAALSDSMREASDDVLTWSANAPAMSAASDTARIFADSVLSILAVRSERSRATVDRIFAQREWSFAPPSAWREWWLGVTFDELSNEPEVPDSESPFFRLHAFQERIVERDPEPLSALVVFQSMLDLPPLDRLLPQDRVSLQSQIQLFLNQRRDVLVAPLEPRVEDIDEPSAVVQAGTTVLDNIAAARSELVALRTAMFLTGTNTRN